MFTGFVRTIILYLLIIAGVRLMGKRQVGELEPSELVLSLIIADLASVPMQDNGIPLLAGVIPIVTLLAMAGGGAPEDDPRICVMDLDRPFLFVIRSGDAVLFAGVVDSLM